LKGEEETGLTEETIRALGDWSFPVPVVPISLEKYSWTSGLNAGIALVNELCIAEEIIRDDVKILNLSFDAVINEENIARLAKRLHKRFVASVRKEMPEDLLGTFEKLFLNPAGVMPGDYVHYFRNTLELYNLRDLLAQGGFNPACNESGGMEDVEFFLRFLKHAERSGRTDILGEFVEALKDPVYYTDKRLVSMNAEKHAEKIAYETDSLARIFSNAYRTLEGKPVEEADRDFALRL